MTEDRGPRDTLLSEAVHAVTEPGLQGLLPSQKNEAYNRLFFCDFCFPAQIAAIYFAD